MKTTLLRILPYSHHHGIRQFYKFAIVGVSNTLLDFIIYFTLTRLFLFFSTHFALANIISFSIAVSNSFFWNRRWTFRSTEDRRVIQYGKFFLVNIAGLGINTLLLYLLVTRFEIYDILAKVFAIAVTLFWNFFMGRVWVFKDSLVAKKG